jgi:hypothetical protein
MKMITLMIALTTAAVLVLAAGAQAKSTKVLKAAPVSTPTPGTTYKLRNGHEVEMSDTQKAIANGQMRPKTPQEIARIAASITVKIETEIDSENHPIGTGFFINASQVQTVYHAVRDAVDIRVTDSKGGEYNATLWSYNASADLAVINVTSADSKNWAWFVTDSDLEEVGERIYVYGNPVGVEGTFTEGILSAVRTNGAILQLSAPLDYGSSGSPVFNEYGMVIGVVSYKKEHTTAEIFYAISSNTIYEAGKLKNRDHPNGFNPGVSADLELRDQYQIDADNARLKAAKTTLATEAAFEQILEDVKLFSDDKVAAYAWTVTMRDLGSWNDKLTADYWLNDVIKRYPDPDDQERLLADINALLKLQGHNLLSPSDDQIRANNEQALKRLEDR